MTRNITHAFESAKDRYGSLGVDVEKALGILKKISLSVHCWQGDDVGGFEHEGATLDGGGIQVTGNYPGKARNIGELRTDLEKVYSLLPGKHRLNLHANYADFSAPKFVDRDRIEPRHFQSWLDWALSLGISLDFNSTFFSHPKAGGMTLASKDRDVRDFWIEHTKRCRAIGAHFGKEQKSPSIHNIWIADGMKDIPADRGGYRETLRDSLDTILAEKISPSYVKDAVESKVFGIGTESYVVGSHEFYFGYAATRKTLLCLDMGHFHPTESVADKISSTLLFIDEILLHVSRGIRWDSDHVVIYNDELLSLALEIIRSGMLDKIHIGLDFFDGSINRVGAWAIGSRATLKALLFALLEPRSLLIGYEETGNNFARLALMEQMKSLPLGAVWDYYCESSGVIGDDQLIAAIHEYEKTVTAKRG